MYIELSCGRCEHRVAIDSDDDTAVWSMVHRFSNAHTECGFISPVGATDIPVEEVKRRLVQPRKFAEDD